MIYGSDGQVVDLEDRYISSSPYLSDLCGPDDDDGEGIIVLAQPTPIISDYVRFLEGKEVTMTDELTSFIEFMGHTNI